MPPSPRAAAAVDTAAAVQSTRRRRRRHGVVLVMVGTAVLTAAALWISRDVQATSTFGAPAVTAATVASTPQHTAAPPSFAAAAQTDAPVPATSETETVTSPVTAINAGPPTRLIIPTLGVDAPVDEVFSGGRVLRPPDDPNRVGWWVGSAPTGVDEGSIVLVGHVDSAVLGPGAMFRLNELDPGAQITVRTTVGTTAQFIVSARMVYPKTSDLPADLFRTTGPPQLTLITCGGEFDQATLSYEENIVVSAVPSV